MFTSQEEFDKMAFLAKNAHLLQYKFAVVATSVADGFDSEKLNFNHIRDRVILVNKDFAAGASEYLNNYDDNSPYGRKNVIKENHKVSLIDLNDRMYRNKFYLALFNELDNEKEGSKDWLFVDNTISSKFPSVWNLL